MPTIIFTATFLQCFFSSASSSRLMLCTGAIFQIRTLLNTIIPHARFKGCVYKRLTTSTNVCTVTEHIKQAPKLFRCTPPTKLRNIIKIPVTTANSGIICKYTAIPKQVKRQLNISSPI